MIDKHGMPPIEGDDRKLVLDYLEKTYPPTRARGARLEKSVSERERHAPSCSICAGRR